MTHRLLPTLPTLLLASLAVGPRPAAAQDVEMLARRYGTTPPEGYLRAKRADPTAFRFRRGWMARTEAAMRARGGRGVGSVGAGATGLGSPALVDGTGAASSTGGPASVLGPRSGAVEGDFTLPVLLGLFSNSGGAPFSAPTIEVAYFGGGPETIPAYYAEVSGGLVTLNGDMIDWVTAPRPDTAYTVAQSGIPGPPYPGLGGGGAWNFVWELLQALEARGAPNWGDYDNDGPDGQPNSGDDDGYVDVLTVIQPSRGAECGGSGGANRIWSHSWALSAPLGAAFTTSTPRTGGGFIRIDDYTIQPAIACFGGGLTEIGVFTHELGHAFGLPDLYDTDGGHSGAGNWDLMASGSWGCDDDSPAAPCQMGAWSKAVLGWVDVVTLAPDVDHGTLMLPPVETSGTVYRVDAGDGSGEYFLLENRQRFGFDGRLYGEGLLIWQIDEDWVLSRWAGNTVNASEHMGVWLRQADGRDDLGNGSGSGDDGDPFPGQTGNSAFHAGSNPGSVSYGGGATGLTVLDIAPAVGDAVSLRLLTRFTNVTLRSQGAANPVGILTVNGQPADSVETFLAAPFETNTVEAAAGETTSPGERRPFLEWLDAPAAPRVRQIVTPLVDSTFVAAYGGLEYELAMTVTGGVNGVEPVDFVSDPPSEDLWFGDGADVTLEARARTGFRFAGWTGGLAGQANPAVFTMSAPFSAGADFDLIYGLPEASVVVPAATALDVRLEVENGTPPVRWTLRGGTLPAGVALSVFGEISGSALELGRFPLTFDAVDANGLAATGTVTLEVERPSIPIDRLASPFLLSGGTLSAAEVDFLNRQGNRVAGYDLGDFRAWVLTDPTLPLSADLSAPTLQATVVITPSGAVRVEGR